MKRLTFIVFILFILSQFSTALAQDKKASPKYGISASFQDKQFDLIFPFWVKQYLKISPAFSFLYVSDAGKDYSIGVIPQFYIKRAKVSPYVGFRLGAIFSSPENGDGTTDMILGLSFGGEYFIDTHFSFGIEAQLNYVSSDKKSFRFGNPNGVNINTATAIFGSIYF